MNFKTWLRILSASLFLVCGSVYAGSYEDRLRDIESRAVQSSPCDRDEKAMRVLVVRELDQWADRTHDSSGDGDDSDSIADQNDDWIHIGPLKLHPRVEDATEVTWKEQTFSWAQADEKRKALRGLDDSDVKWKTYQKSVIRLLGYDQRRRVDEQDLSLTHHHVEIGNAVASSADDCQNDEISRSDCPGFEGLRETSLLRRENTTFSADFSQWKSANSSSAAQTAFAALRDYAHFLAEYETPRKTSGISFRDGTLEVPMIAGDFAGYESDLAKVIEKFWNRLSDTLRIRWVRDSNSFFTFLFLDRPGRSSNTNRTKQTVTLVAETRESSPAHEFGHVLGFRDNYFNIWDAEGCSYTYQFQEGDLMSEVSKGLILPEHWQQIHRVYGQ